MKYTLQAPFFGLGNSNPSVMDIKKSGMGLEGRCKFLEIARRFKVCPIKADGDKVLINSD
jgi:hypothetical protein